MLKIHLGSCVKNKILLKSLRSSRELVLWGAAPAIGLSYIQKITEKDEERASLTELKSSLNITTSFTKHVVQWCLGILSN